MTEILNFIQNNSGYIILALAVLVIVLLGLLVYTMINFNKLNKKYNAFMTGKEPKSLENVILKRFSEIDELKDLSKNNKEMIDQIIDELQCTYKKVGLEKYDAFNEMGGKLSFALAMLNKRGNGFLINSMHSREGCYTYVKEVVRGECAINLGEEEKKALKKALDSDGYIIE